MSGTWQIVLPKQCEYLGSGHIRDAMQKVVLTCRLICFRQHSRRANHISLRKFQAGKKYFTDNKSVNNLLILPCEAKGLLPMLFGGIQLIPFIEYTGQAKMCFVDNLLRLIAYPLQDALVGLGRLI